MAESNPKDKERMVGLVVNLLGELVFMLGGQKRECNHSRFCLGKYLYLLKPKT